MLKVRDFKWTLNGATLPDSVVLDQIASGVARYGRIFILAPDEKTAGEMVEQWGGVKLTDPSQLTGEPATIIAHVGISASENVSLFARWSELNHPLYWISPSRPIWARDGAAQWAEAVLG